MAFESIPKEHKAWEMKMAESSAGWGSWQGLSLCTGSWTMGLLAVCPAFLPTRPTVSPPASNTCHRAGPSSPEWGMGSALTQDDNKFASFSKVLSVTLSGHPCPRHMSKLYLESSILQALPLS